MTTSVQELAGAETAPRRMSTGALVAVLAAATLPVISFFSVNVALGQIGAELGASEAMLQLVVAAYGVAYASLVVIGGRLGDGFGRCRMMVLGLAGFIATSLVCAIAQSPEQLVAARLFQGVAAALVAPQVLATIHASNEGAHRDRAVGLFGAMAGVATSIAFLIGGALTSADVSWLGWRAVFWINAPIGIAVIVAALRWMPEVRGPSRPRLDLVGAGLLAVAMTLLIGPLTEGRAVGWPAWTWIALAAFVPSAVVFVWWQRRGERRGGMPLVPPSMLAMRSMAVGLAIGAPFFTAFGGFMFVYALTAQATGMSAFETGVNLLPMSLLFLAASVLSSRLVRRFGVNVLTVGALLAMLGYAAIGLAVGSGGPSDATTVFPAMALAGFGIGLVWSPLFGIVVSQVPAASAGLGSGILITTLQMFLGLGSAVVGSLYLGLAPDDGASTAFAETMIPLSAAMVPIAGLTRALVRRPVPVR